MDLNKPVELMTDDEREAYNLAMRKAILQGDDGILPNGRTVRQEREGYVELCNNDPFRTRTHVEGEQTEALGGAGEIASLFEGDDFPSGGGGGGAELPPADLLEVSNKRCC